MTTVPITSLGLAVLLTLPLQPLTAVGPARAEKSERQAGAATRPAFEVASVRQNKTVGERRNWQVQPGGRFTVTNTPLRALIRMAYGFNTLVLPNQQIVGAPGWIDSDRFDITAKTDAALPADNTAARDAMLGMLRTLLEERFKLRAHTEERQLPLFELVRVKKDGSLGPELKAASGPCSDGAAASAAAAAAAGIGGAGAAGAGAGAAGAGGGAAGAGAAGASGGGAASAGAAGAGGGAAGAGAAGGGARCGISSTGPGVLIGRGVPMVQLVAFLQLSPAVGRVVRDRTDLQGNFDFRLDYVPPLVQGPTGGFAPNPAAETGLSLLTALQEQLGLKLESKRGPVEVLVIDSIEKLAEQL